MSNYPDVRLRRFRRSSGLRGLVRETHLRLDQFVMPLFVAPESLRNEQLPGMSRYTVDGRRARGRGARPRSACRR